MSDRSIAEASAHTTNTRARLICVEHREKIICINCVGVQDVVMITSYSSSSSLEPGVGFGLLYKVISTPFYFQSTPSSSSP